jgi:hypothetical protein
VGDLLLTDSESLSVSSESVSGSSSSKLESPESLSSSEGKSPSSVSSESESVSALDVFASARLSLSDSDQSSSLGTPSELSSQSENSDVVSSDDSLGVSLGDDPSLVDSVSLDDVLPSETLGGSVDRSPSGASSLSVSSDTESSSWVSFVGGARSSDLLGNNLWWKSLLDNDLLSWSGDDNLNVLSSGSLGGSFGGVNDGGLLDGPGPCELMSSTSSVPSSADSQTSLLLTSVFPDTANLSPSSVGNNPLGGSVGVGLPVTNDGVVLGVLSFRALSNTGLDDSLNDWSSSDNSS